MHRARLLSSSSSKHKKRPLGFYEKALPPPNPRYAHVPSRIDTGPTVQKLCTVTTRQFVRRRDEVFARVTPAQLAALAAEYGEGGPGDDALSFSSSSSSSSSSSVIVTYDPAREVPLYEKPYLLLDVRADADTGTFEERARLVDARHLPPHLLRQDRLPPELLRFRNREGTLLILYDQNDGAPAEAVAMATELVLRGWENVYVLSGGLEVVAAEHPHLVEGLPASSPSPAREGQKGDNGNGALRLCEANLARLALAPRGKGGYAGSSSSSTYKKGGARTASVASAAGSLVRSNYRGGGGSHCLRPPPSVTTAGTRLSVAETVIARAQARKGMF